MAELSDFPYADVEFGTDGSVADDDQREAALELPESATDLLVISHGWNNDMAEARRLYASLASSLRSVLRDDPPDGFNDRKLAIIGVLWPSKRFAETDLIPGGAASIGAGADADSVRDEVDELADFLDSEGARTDLSAARALVDTLGDSPVARKQFAEHVRSALTGVEDDDVDAATEFFDEDGEELMTRLARPVFVGQRPQGSLDRGGAAGLGDVFSNAYKAARNLLNVSTYYEMKSRAGAVGETGVADLLADLRSAYPDLRIHLAGHSFGARVVSAAALAGSAVLPLSSVSLLQAAFSHYGFAEDWEPGEDGFFRAVVLKHRIDGPMLITHTKNDDAVGIAYAVASRVAGQVAQGVGDAGDKFGGLGRNGAQKTPEAVNQSLLGVGVASYAFENGTLHNLLADDFISSHGDVTGKEVAYALLSAVAHSGA